MSEASTQIHPSAVIDEPSAIGEGTRIWHFCHVMAGARIGRHCILGQNVFVAAGVVVGNGVKIQNNVSLYTGVEVEDHVFLGPSCVLTNVMNPRAEINRRAEYTKTLLRRGATIGANATIVCGITVGRYAFVAAGAVVSRNVPDYALMVGVPAVQRGWFSRHAFPLPEPDEQGVMICPDSGLRYQRVSAERIRCLDLDEEQPLPAELAVRSRPYRERKP